MKARSTIPILALALLATSSAARAETARPARLPVSPAEASALRVAADPALAGLRAGAHPVPAPLGSRERAALRTVSSRGGDLERMRAGHIEISDQEFKVLAVVLGVLLILVLI